MKYWFHTLPLIYHPKGQNEASYNSEMPENHIIFFEDEHLRRLRRPRFAVQNARNKVSILWNWKGQLQRLSRETNRKQGIFRIESSEIKGKLRCSCRHGFVNSLVMTRSNKALIATKTAFTRCRHILKTMKNVTVAKFELAFTRCRNNLKTVRNLPVKSSLQDFDAN